MNAVAVMVSVAGSREFKTGYLPAGSLWVVLVAKEQVQAEISSINGSSDQILGFDFKIMMAA